MVQFNPFTLRNPLEPNVCYFRTFANNLRTKLKFTKYLKESCSLDPDKHFSFKCFPDNAFESNILVFSKFVRPVLAPLSVNGLMLITWHGVHTCGIKKGWPISTSVFLRRVF